MLRTQAADFDGDEHHAPSMTGQDSASFSVGTPPMSNDGGGGSDRLLLPSPAKPPSCPEDKGKEYPRVPAYRGPKNVEILPCSAVRVCVADLRSKITRVCHDLFTGRGLTTLSGQFPHASLQKVRASCG